MNLIKTYKNYLLLDHNRQYYYYNTFFLRFIKSETNFREIFQIFLNDGFIILMLVLQIEYFYKVNLYFFIWTHLLTYFLLSAKLILIKLKYK